MEFHEYANIFPMMTAEEHAGLCESMRKHGFDSAAPIITYGGKILDGRNRYKASAETGKPPVFNAFEGDNQAALDFVMRHNLERRNLDSGQRAAIGVEYKQRFAVLAKERQLATLKQNKTETTVPQFFAEREEEKEDSDSESKTSVVEKIPQRNAEENKAREQAAAVVGSNSRYIDDAEKIKKDAPQVFEALKQGKVNVPSAKVMASLPEEQQTEVIKNIDSGDKPKDAINKVAHVSHNSGNNEWYTPKEYIEAARLVMGTIDTDPASSEIANKTVKATRYHTAEEDGLSWDWDGNVWMNPPYSQPLIGEFCDKLLTDFNIGMVVNAIVLVNNATDTKWGQSLISSAAAVCFPKGRIRFVDPEGKPSGAPLQGQMIVYFGSKTKEFVDQFSQFGVVLLCAGR